MPCLPLVSCHAALDHEDLDIVGSRIQELVAIGSLSRLDAILVAKLAPLCTPAMRWIALFFFCSAYLQGGLTKALNFDAAIEEMKRFG